MLYWLKNIGGGQNDFLFTDKIERRFVHLVTVFPFWENFGFKDSGLIDPDDNKHIYIKK